jgi:hypothetical protein
VEEFSGGGVVDGAHHRQPILRAGDHDRPVRQPAHEVGGAVDGVDHPIEARGTELAPVLLAHDPVVWPAGGDGVADQRLGRAVGVGDEVLVPLALDHEVVECAEARQSEVSCPAGEVDGEGQAVIKGNVISPGLWAHLSAASMLPPSTVMM